jgi:hypothetical protein
MKTLTFGGIFQTARLGAILTDFIPSFFDYSPSQWGFREVASNRVAVL